MRALLCSCLLAFSCSAWSQDTAYARRVIRYLTSEKCFGRGYVKNGLDEAARYIAAELKQQDLKPLWGKQYFQSFRFPVNTFPGNMEVKLDGTLLTPGIDYIMNPASSGAKGKFRLMKQDSVTFIGINEKGKGKNFMDAVVTVKKKLTFSVAREALAYCSLELLKRDSYTNPQIMELNIGNKLLKNHENKNIGAFIPGTRNNDSVIIFSAHYDHLGGMGKNTFFPGANDNASGVSVLLNLVKYYAAHPPAYKMVFLFFAGEEAGLLGSKHFVESGCMDLKTIRFLINLDLLGTGDDGIMVVNGALHEKQFELLNEINAEKMLVKEIRKRGKAANSDHYWFGEKGVPCFFIYTLGGVTAYHDVQDIARTLPLTDYADVCRLIIEFAARL